MQSIPFLDSCDEPEQRTHTNQRLNPLRNEPTTMDTANPTELTIMLDNILVAISGG
ncbi:MAG TPA: hypothetical protein VHJ59_02285 [Nitrososphaera sp.]|nr:hypothetical protein [Nitrososphaera sp.]